MQAGIGNNAPALAVLAPERSALVHAISYAAPTTVADAVSILAEHGANARMLAGGTDLIVQVREKLRDTTVFVDAKHIPDLMQLVGQCRWLGHARRRRPLPSNLR